MLSSTLCAQRPQAAVVIGVDGMSVDGIDKANAPNLKALMKPALRLAAIYDWDGFGRLFERSAVNHIACWVGKPLVKWR